MHSMKRTLTALLLALGMLLSAFGLAACGKSEEGFDFLKENMADYITVDPSLYENATLDVTLPDPVDDKAIDAYITQMLNSYYSQKAETKTIFGDVIKKGDTVRIWYRGEVNIGTDTEPNFVEFIGGCNFYGSQTAVAAATDLTIGSGQFIAGFEDALIGLDTSASSLKTVTGTSNYIGKEGLLPIAYIRYNYRYTDANGNEKKGVFFDRIDLTKDGDKYVNPGRYTGEDGVALRDALAGMHVKDVIKNREFTMSFDITQDLEPETVTIKNVEVTHIVKADTALPFAERDKDGKLVTDTDGNVTVDANKPYTFEIVFPAKYGNASLAGKTSRWYVYAEQIVRPVGAPEIKDLTYTHVKDILGIKYETMTAVLNRYPDEVEAAAGNEDKKQALVLKYYREYIKEGLESQNKATLQGSVVDALWRHIIDELTVISYPEGVIENYVASQRTAAQSDWEQYSQSYGSTVYATMAEYVVNNYNNNYSVNYFTTPDKVDEGFRKIAEDQLKQEMAIHYIAKVLGKDMSGGKQEKYYREQMDAMLAYYNEIYGSQLNGQTLTEQDLINQGYTKQSMISEKYYNDVSAYLYETYYKAKYEALYAAESAS